MAAATEQPTRQLNHVEFVYRPGERELTKRVFELLGCRTMDRGGPFLTAFIEPSSSDINNNCFYASEVTPEQLALEDALVAAMDGDGAVAHGSRAYLERLRHEPQRAFHFGVRYPELADLEAAVERIRVAGENDADLKGRVGVSGVFYPGDPGSYTDTMVQAFVHTDVVAAGLLAFDQHIELQWQRPE